MATDKHTVSIYVDQDLLNALNEFKDSGNPKYKSLNVAIVAILREKLFGEVSDNVQSKVQSNVQSTLDIEAMIAAAIEKQSPAPDVDIESIVNDAVRSKVLELREEFEEHEKINQAQHQKGFEAQIATFRSEYDAMIEAKIAAALEATASPNFTSALLQRAKEVAPLKMNQAA